MSDPFAPNNDAPSDPWGETAPNHNTQEAPVTVPAETRDRFSIKLTLKANESYNAEWINPWVSGQTADEAAANTVAMLNALAEHGVIDKVSNAAEYTRGQYKGRPGGSSRGGGGGGGGYQRNQGGGGQQNNSLPPGVQQKTCQHGDMVFRTGKNRYGKDYQAFFCPTDKDADDKCKPMFLDGK